MSLTEIPLKPPLKWAGGKRWLVPLLQPLWEVHLKQYPEACLVEPFCGGLAVTLGLQPERALLNDINPHLINFYRWLQKGLVIDLNDLPMRNDPDLFYAHRDRFNALITTGKAETAEAAALFYYLNRTGFNGLCRFNKQGAFNVPFGRYKTINYRTDFTPYRRRFERWRFLLGGFEQLSILPNDFVYVDPPYDVEFTQYSAGGFTWDDQVALAQWLSRLHCPVALSNQATARIVELYTDLGFILEFHQTPRRISANGDRTPAREVLALKHVQSA